MDPVFYCPTLIGIPLELKSRSFDQHLLQEGDPRLSLTRTLDRHRLTTLLIGNHSPSIRRVHVSGGRVRCEKGQQVVSASCPVF